MALVWQGQAKVALCLLAGISVGVTCAAVIGVAIPNLLRLLRRDPQVAAGPVALAAADMVTLLVYFSLARALFRDPGAGHTPPAGHTIAPVDSVRTSAVVKGTAACLPPGGSGTTC